MRREQLAVYVILDPDYAGGRPLAAIAEAAAAGGATLLQLRAEGLSTYAQVQLAQELMAVSRARGVPLLINDRVDVALAVGAAGVHVGHPGVDDMPPDTARRLLGPDAIIGVSVATPEEAAAVARLPVDYLSTGPIFATRSKADAGPAVGPERLAAVRAATTLPLCAIGGLTADNAAAAVRAGADGVAVIGAVSLAPDPRTATERLAQVVRAARFGA